MPGGFPALPCATICSRSCPPTEVFLPQADTWRALRLKQPRVELYLQAIARAACTAAACARRVDSRDGGVVRCAGAFRTTRGARRFGPVGADRPCCGFRARAPGIGCAWTVRTLMPGRFTRSSVEDRRCGSGQPTAARHSAACLRVVRARGHRSHRPSSLRREKDFTRRRCSTRRAFRCSVSNGLSNSKIRVGTSCC